jgi:hypothetical protein
VAAGLLVAAGWVAKVLSVVGRVSAHGLQILIAERSSFNCVSCCHAPCLGLPVCSIYPPDYGVCNLLILLSAFPLQRHAINGKACCCLVDYKALFGASPVFDLGEKRYRFFKRSSGVFSHAVAVLVDGLLTAFEHMSSVRGVAGYLMISILWSCVCSTRCPYAQGSDIVQSAYL